MDPLAAADTIINHAQRIFELVEAAKTNTEECKTIKSRVKRLEAVAQRIRQQPDPLLVQQVCNVEEVMDSAKKVVEKYSKMKRGMQRVLQVLKAVQIQHQFDNINASLDSVWQDLNAAVSADTRTTVLNVQTEVQQVQSQLQGSTLMNQMDDCARLILRQHMPEHYVEVDDRVNTVESLLQSTTAPVVAVVGMGGIGKTTLVRAVYNKLSSLGKFKLGWATVGKEANFSHCLKQIWRQLVSSNSEPQCSNADDLKMELLCKLEEECVLLVVDDIWSVRDLEKLWVTATNGSSKLLLTTRDVEVARRVDADIYHVDVLTEDLSLQLFCRCAFGESQIPVDKKEYSMVVDDMVKECAQLPLALQVVGSMAKGYHGMEQWKSGAKKLQQFKSLGIAFDCDLLSVTTS